MSNSTAVGELPANQVCQQIVAQVPLAKSGQKARTKPSGIDALNRIVENDLIHRVSDDEYREKIKDVYGGPKGALLATAA